VSREAAGLPALAAWHAGWAATAGLFTLGALWLAGLSGPAVFGAMAMVARTIARLPESSTRLFTKLRSIFRKSTGNPLR
jgi:hypothetical protein